MHWTVLTHTSRATGTPPDDLAVIAAMNAIANQSIGQFSVGGYGALNATAGQGEGGSAGDSVVAAKDLNLAELFAQAAARASSLPDWQAASQRADQSGGQLAGNGSEAGSEQAIDPPGRLPDSVMPQSWLDALDDLEDLAQTAYDTPEQLPALTDAAILHLTAMDDPTNPGTPIVQTCATTEGDTNPQDDPCGNWTPEVFFKGMEELIKWTGFGCGGLAAWRAGLKPTPESGVQIDPFAIATMPGAKAYMSLQSAMQRLKELGGRGLVVAIQVNDDFREGNEEGRRLFVGTIRGMDGSQLYIPRAFGEPFHGNFATLLGTGTPFWEYATRGWSRGGVVVHKPYRASPKETYGLPRFKNTVFFVIPNSVYRSPFVNF